MIVKHLTQHMCNSDIECNIKRNEATREFKLKIFCSACGMQVDRTFSDATFHCNYQSISASIWNSWHTQTIEAGVAIEPKPVKHSLEDQAYFEEEKNGCAYDPYANEERPVIKSFWGSLRILINRMVLFKGRVEMEYKIIDVPIAGMASELDKYGKEDKAWEHYQTVCTQNGKILLFLRRPIKRRGKSFEQLSNGLNIL